MSCHELPIKLSCLFFTVIFLKLYLQYSFSSIHNKKAYVSNVRHCVFTLHRRCVGF